jgi:hypothetical protein
MAYSMSQPDLATIPYLATLSCYSRRLLILRRLRLLISLLILKSLNPSELLIRLPLITLCRVIEPSRW